MQYARQKTVCVIAFEKKMSTAVTNIQIANKCDRNLQMCSERYQIYDEEERGEHFVSLKKKIK